MDLRSLIDIALEISVIGSFSRVGYQVRHRLFGWTAPTDGALAGKTVLITGPTSGLGRATAHAVAALGGRVVLVGRSEERLARVRDELVAAHGQDRFPVVVADMASLASVRVAVATILATETRLDVLVDNAGSIFPDRRETPDGIEATFATMVVGPFVLVSGLLPLLERTGGARVVAVTSGGQYTQALPLGDLGYSEGSFSGARAYARAKRAQTALVREWARRLVAAGSDVSVTAMHPGWAATPGLADTLPGFYQIMGPLLRTADQGIDTITWLATAPSAEVERGRLYLDRRPRPFDRVRATRLSPADRRRLWDEVVVASAGSDPAHLS